MLDRTSFGAGGSVQSGVWDKTPRLRFPAVDAITEQETMSTLESLAIQPTVYYTAEEAAQLLRVSPPTMLALLQSRRVQAVRINDQWRVLGAALLDLTGQEHQSEAELVSDWLAVSGRSLQEVWDNDEDAVYDQL
jgi:excisionase family DNA binding protein